VNILIGSEGTMRAALLHSTSTEAVTYREFRHYFASYFIRRLVVWSWWVGAVLGGLLVLRRGGTLADLPWGIIAGSVAGVAGSATLASAYLVIEVVPHLIWGLALSGKGGTIFWFLLWVLLALVGWMLSGLLVGLVLSLVPPLRRHVLIPVQKAVGGFFRLCGMRGLAGACGCS
jgi:hypothetical protein